MSGARRARDRLHRGRTGARDRARFERHLAGCPHCTIYVDQLRITIRALGRLEPESISPEAREALLTAFRDWKGGELS